MKQAKDLLDEIKRQAEKKSAKVEGALQELGNIQSEISSLKKDIINLVKDNNSTKKDIARAKKDTARVSRELAKKDQQASDRAKAGLPALSDDDKKSREATLAKNRAYKDELKYITARDSNASLKAKIKEANSVRPKPKLYANEKAYEKEKAKEKIESFATQAQAGEVNWSVDALQLGKNYDPKKKDNKNPIKKSTNEFEKLNKEVAKTTKYMRIFGAALLGKKAFDTAKNIAEDRHQSRMLWGGLGLNREQQKKWQRFATSTGYDENVVASSMGNTNNILAELKKGNAIPSDILEVLTNQNASRGLGLNIADLKNMNGEQAYQTIMERMLKLQKTNPEAFDNLTLSNAMQSLLGPEMARWIQQVNLQGKNPDQVYKDSMRPVAEIAGYDKRSGERQQAWSRLMDRLAEILDRLIDALNPFITKLLDAASFLLGETEGDKSRKRANATDKKELRTGTTEKAIGWVADKVGLGDKYNNYNYDKYVNQALIKSQFGDKLAKAELDNLMKQDPERFKSLKEGSGLDYAKEIYNEIFEQSSGKERDLIKSSGLEKALLKEADGMNYSDINEKVLPLLQDYIAGKTIKLGGQDIKGVNLGGNGVALANAGGQSTNSTGITLKIDQRIISKDKDTKVINDVSTPTRANIQKG